MRAATWLLRALAAEGVRHVFLVPAAPGHAFPFDAAAAAGVVPIAAASEAGAAMMADGHARASGRFGVCLAEGGPGAAGLVAPAATARADGAPVLFVTWGEEKAAWPGLPDEAALLAPVTAASLAVAEPGRLGPGLRASLTRMLAGPKAPVHLRLSPRARLAEGAAPWTPLDPSAYAPRFVDAQAVERLWRVLVPEGGGPAPTRLAVLAGAGVGKSEAAKQLLAFAELFEIPVATTLGAKGVFPEDHRLSLGVPGRDGAGLAGRLLCCDDLEGLVLLGCSLAGADIPARVLAQVDVDPAVPGRDVSVDVPVVGDCREALSLMMEGGSARINRLRAGNQARAAWLRRIGARGPAGGEGAAVPGVAAPLEPAGVVAALRRALPRQGCLAVDAGAVRDTAARCFAAFAPRTFFAATGRAPEGWAIAAAAGIKAALPDRPVACLTDASGMLGRGLEVATAVRHGLRVVYVVVNAQAPGQAWDGAPAAMPPCDFAALGRALGARGLAVERGEELDRTLALALAGEGPCVVDVRRGRDPA